jgi:phospholipase C
MRNFTRRELLKLATAATAAELASFGLHGCGASNLVSSVVSGCSKLSDIEHVVILTQENRSFDHYFGSYRGVRGFSDQSAAF